MPEQSLTDEIRRGLYKMLVIVTHESNADFGYTEEEWVEIEKAIMWVDQFDIEEEYEI